MNTFHFRYMEDETIYTNLFENIKSINILITMFNGYNIVLAHRNVSKQCRSE